MTRATGSKGTRNPRLVLIRHGRKRAWIYPEQGFQLHGFEQDFGRQGIASVIYSPGALVEPADRRHGNPVLFPNPGVVRHRQGPERWEWRDRILPMPFHGFARNLYWHTVDIQSDRVTGELSMNSTARLSFPFDFRLRLTYLLDRRGLVLETELQNTGKEAFPYALGFHPYIRAPLGRKGSVEDAFVDVPSGARISTADEWRTFRGERFSARQVQADDDLAGTILLAESGARFLDLRDLANGLIARVSLAESESDFGVWAIWSASPRSPYVCLEPWTDLPNALNRTKTRRCLPGKTDRYRMILSVRAT